MKNEIFHIHNGFYIHLDAIQLFIQQDSTKLCFLSISIFEKLCHWNWKSSLILFACLSIGSYQLEKWLASHWSSYMFAIMSLHCSAKIALVDTKLVPTLNSCQSKKHNIFYSKFSNCVGIFRRRFVFCCSIGPPRLSDVLDQNGCLHSSIHIRWQLY